MIFLLVQGDDLIMILTIYGIFKTLSSQCDPEINLTFLKGYDWQWGDQDGSEESIGTVYRVEGRGEVYVS